MDKLNTRNNFIMAFWKLYEIKPIEKISIRELCETAGYNRTTFYAHLHNIYDLLNESIIELVSPIKDNIDFINKLVALSDINSIQEIFLKFFDENNRYIQLLLNNNDHFILENKVKEIVVPQLKERLDDTYNSSIYVEYIIEYQISAIFGVLRYWFKDKTKKVSKEELSNILLQISTKGAFTMLNKNFI